MPTPGKLESVRAAFPGGIAIVGLGRWGSSLQAALVALGVPPVEIVANRRHLKSAHLDAGLIWLAVPDDALATVAAIIAARRLSLRGQVMVHSSGVYSGEVLAAARRAGAKVGSAHPLMTFPTRKAVPLERVRFAVEGDRGVATKLETLIRSFGGRPFRVPSANKALYHAAAVMASPLLLSLATAAQEVAVMSGLSLKEAAQWMEPMMLRTIFNFFGKGAEQSFSGPFARGDAATVSLHRAALAGHPSLQQLYIALASHALRVLPVQNPAALRKALAGPQHPILGKARRQKGTRVTDKRRNEGRNGGSFEH